MVESLVRSALNVVEVILVVMPDETRREAEESVARAPKRGSTLEGRIRVFLERRGFHAVTNRVVLDHEFDVWAEDRDGRYRGGVQGVLPVGPSHTCSD